MRSSADAAGQQTAFALRVERGDLAASKEDGALGQGDVAALDPDMSRR
jgi:hypothetical protein